ncbi:hypothetical protein BT93_E1141 [Corymbia citriodora subsp. variegata]|nr:hypothetical protein BT93_E1141 [Corymbia citriodora subsp. variegata]
MADGGFQASISGGESSGTREREREILDRGLRRGKVSGPRLTLMGLARAFGKRNTRTGAQQRKFLYRINPFPDASPSSLPPRCLSPPVAIAARPPSPATTNLSTEHTGQDDSEISERPENSL